MVAALFIIPVRLLAYPFLPEVLNRAVGSLACTVCVALSCVLLLRPSAGEPSSSARTLAFIFPTIAFVSWLDGLGPELGIPLTSTIGLWFIDGVAVAGVKISAFLNVQRERASSLRDELAAHYREITENSTDLFAEIDQGGTIVYANPAHARVLGVDPKDLIGKPGTAIELTPAPADMPEVDWDETGLHRMIGITRHRGTHHSVTLECSFYRVHDANGELRTVITARDISARAAQERDRAELNVRLEALVEKRTEELRTSLQQLEEANRLAALGTMAAGIAHQINNPVGSIQMSAEYALGSRDDDPERQVAWRGALENAIDQAKRCGRIVSNMLQFARNEPTDKRPEDLASILRRACDLTEGYARAHDARLSMRGLDDPIPVLGSAIELEQAFLNIVRNACESSSAPHRVAVVASHDRGHAIVTIEDDGRGIARDDVDHVLDPFFTTRLDAGGTGLGLSVAHGVITDHDGTLSIESEAGVGTKLTVTLPLEKAAAPAREA